MAAVFDFGNQEIITLGALGSATILLVILIISFRSRARIFCQYLKYLSGIEISPKMVNTAFRTTGRAGVRDLLVDLIIQEDLSDPSRIVTPDSKPDRSIYDSGIFEP